jgi:hypothetical protein
MLLSNECERLFSYVKEYKKLLFHAIFLQYYLKIWACFYDLSFSKSYCAEQREAWYDPAHSAGYQ